MTTRNSQIIQIAATIDSEGNKLLFALRSDGAIYAHYQGKWREMPPVPDTLEPTIQWKQSSN